MGLDMYLKCNSRPLTQRVHEGDPYGEYISDWYRRSGTVIYWRKANAIHKWFVDNVQGGNDDCGTYEVEWEQLTNLRDTCREVLADIGKATELLPPTEGFFFGSTEIDDWYRSDLEHTASEIDRIGDMLVDLPGNVRGRDGEPLWYYKVIPEEPDWNVVFTYHSSW